MGLNSPLGFLRGLVDNPMWRRLAVLLVIAAILPVGGLALFAARELAQRNSETVDMELSGHAHFIAETIGARLEAADSLAGQLAAGSSASSIAELRAATANSGVFMRALVGDVESDSSSPVAMMPAPSGWPRARRASTALMAIASRGDLGSAYLVRGTRIGGREALVYFELAPQWLWRGIGDAAQPAVVVDVRGTMLLRPNGEDAAHAARVVGADVAAHGPNETGDGRVAWQATGSEWRGAIASLRLPASFQVDAPWRVASVMPAASPWYAVGPVWRIALAAAVLAVLFALLLSIGLAERYRLALGTLRRAIVATGREKFAPLRLETLPGELAAIGRAVNDIGARLEADVAALETLGEIDRLLLGATELEPALDAILSRVTTVTRCQSVGIALLDADSPTHARVFIAADASQSLPVSRVEIDPDLVESLAATNEGVTIARCEDGRHSFLAPLRELGSEFFWVWPVVTNGRLAAVLAVGFRQEPAPDPRFARHGSEFVTRLAIALSKTARDEHLYRQAHFDPLTSLPNRLLFSDRLAQELASTTEGKTRGALLYVDLDHFKKVNDTVGHAAGDQLLTIVAQRLRACVKDGDTVARLAGDEFTVILRNVADPESASLVSERIIEALKMPVNLSGRDHFVQASIGITLFPDDGNSIEQLLRNADGAMYRAKDLGRSRAVFFDRNLMMSRFDTTHSGLYRALRRREFSLFYQPQYALSDGRLVGLEALLRWQTPRDGTRTPGEFIPAAEASGLIVDIGSWVLEAACSQLAVWREQGIAPSRLSINVSVQQLKYVEFPRNVKRILDKYGIAPELIEIELTESVLADEIASAALRQLADYGLRLALDDFGTGYSSLNYLRQHPIKVVKIDRSFLEDVTTNPASATLAETIITMAHALGKEVVAEGVETAEQLMFLRERHCDLAQGFYLAKPMPVNQVSELLQARAAPAHEDTMRQVG